MSHPNPFLDNGNPISGKALLIYAVGVMPASRAVVRERAWSRFPSKIGELLIFV